MALPRVSRSTIATLFLFFVLTACDKVPKPTSDSTPPNVKWRVENQTTGAVADFGNSGSIVARGGETLRVMLTAEDPEGIAFIELSGGYTTSCVKGSVGSDAAGGFTTDQQSLGPDSDGKVLTTVFLATTSTPDVTCQPGLDWQGTKVTFNGLGRNYFAGKTTGMLTIQATP